eukprot:20397-Heterococcus_DN1.PRE.2
MTLTRTPRQQVQRTPPPHSKQAYNREYTGKNYWGDYAWVFVRPYTPSLPTSWELKHYGEPLLFTCTLRCCLLVMHMKLVSP